MIYTTASCGCSIVAVGSPYSQARLASESRHCGKPRCEAGLPAKFTDQECGAYCWLKHRGFKNWSVDLLTKECRMEKGDSAVTFASLVNAAQQNGWEG